MASAAQLSQLTYQETPYEDQEWEIVGQFTEDPVFEALEIPVVAQRATMFDPMFEDFGGRLGVNKGDAFQSAPGTSSAREKEVKEVEDPSLIKMKPEALEAMKQEAFEAGRQEALRIAVQDNASKIAGLEKNISEVIKDLGAQLGEHLRQVEKNSVELALSISQKIIHHAVDINPEYIGQIVKEALLHVGSSAIRTIKVSPQDFEFIEVVGLPKSLVELDGTWKFVADDSVRTGCVVETSSGEIDFRLDKAWERVSNNILKAVK